MPLLGLSAKSGTIKHIVAHRVAAIDQMRYFTKGFAIYIYRITNIFTAVCPPTALHSAV